jgi:glycosidase
MHTKVPPGKPGSPIEQLVCAVRKCALWRAAAALALAVAAVGPAVPRCAAAPGAASPRDEIFYQIFVRSFRDSKGDRNGDLKGIEDELGYLQDLGVTTLLLTPLYDSPFYHSYFANDFSRIDPAYGTEEDFRHLVRALHKRGMKIFLDEEVQYVTTAHEWFKDSLGNPRSRFSHFIVYTDSANAKPDLGIFGMAELPSYNGSKYGIANVNLHDPGVVEYQTKLFEHWMEPTGRAGDDGVDGFRIDHMMDDLDYRKTMTGLFSRFWEPIFAKLREDDPRVRILAEQADWGYGDDWLRRGGVDMVFAFPIRMAIVSFDKKKLSEAVAGTWEKTPPGKQQVVFIENHDTSRFASEVCGNPRRERLGAALNLLLKGIPLIYYGQELGMEGFKASDWNSDANDIPQREAFPWTAALGPGIAVWYKDTGPWWNLSALARGASVSLEREAGIPDSLLSYYKWLIALRRGHPELISGDQAIVANDSASVFSFVRSDGSRRILVAVNLSADQATAHVKAADVAPSGGASLRSVASGDVTARGADGSFAIALPGYGICIDEVSAGN